MHPRVANIFADDQAILSKDWTLAGKVAQWLKQSTVLIEKQSSIP